MDTIEGIVKDYWLSLDYFQRINFEEYLFKHGKEKVEEEIKNRIINQPKISK